MRGSTHNLASSPPWLRDSSVCAASSLTLALCLLLPWQLQAAESAPTPPRASVDRSGELRVSNGMTLHVTADLGNVRIQALPPGAPPVLHYTVHIETDAPNPAGQKLLDRYSLTTRESVDSVFLSGALPNSGFTPCHLSRPQSKCPVLGAICGYGSFHVQPGNFHGRRRCRNFRYRRTCSSSYQRGQHHRRTHRSIRPSARPQRPPHG